MTLKTTFLAILVPTLLVAVGTWQTIAHLPGDTGVAIAAPLPAATTASTMHMTMAPGSRMVMSAKPAKKA